MAELPTPTRVLDLALAHLEQSDPIRQFVFASYEIYDPNVHGQNRVLFTAKTFYDMFIEATHRRDISLTRFGKSITELGIEKIPGRHV